MINSDYLVISHGAYSEFASILRRGKVLVPDKSVIHIIIGLSIIVST